MEYSQTFVYPEKEGKNTRRRIGIMGGTFNPVHNGHIYMAQKAYEEFALDNVLFIPAGKPPHKGGEGMADKEHRFTMLELAIQDYPYFGTSRVELNRPGNTYTVDTLHLLHRSIENACFYFIIGADTLFELNTWKNFNEVITLTEFICFLRPGARNEAVIQYIQAIFDTYKKEILVSSHEGINVSSRVIRERLTQCKSINGLVDEKVEKYIYENGVY